MITMQHKIRFKIIYVALIFISLWTNVRNAENTLVRCHRANKYYLRPKCQFKGNIKIVLKCIVCENIKHFSWFYIGSMDIDLFAFYTDIGFTKKRRNYRLDEQLSSSQERLYIMELKVLRMYLGLCTHTHIYTVLCFLYRKCLKILLKRGVACAFRPHIRSQKLLTEFHWHLVLGTAIE